eukprot:2009597-Pleurochrysis_carterae.AAC.1
MQGHGAARSKGRGSKRLACPDAESCNTLSRQRGCERKRERVRADAIVSRSQADSCCDRRCDVMLSLTTTSSANAPIRSPQPSKIKEQSLKRATPLRSNPFQEPPLSRATPFKSNPFQEQPLSRATPFRSKSCSGSADSLCPASSRSRRQLR